MPKITPTMTNRVYIPHKRIYAPNDPFFTEGNIELRAIWLKKQAQSDLEVDIIQQEAVDLSKEYNIPIYCDECRIELPSTQAFESHYEAVHRNVCSVCTKIFPGANWLKLHIDEFHNVLLQLKKERGEKIHKCYVEDCEKIFSEPKMRRLHLIDKHKYPKHFPFDLVYTGTLSFEQRRQRDEKNKQRIQQKQQQQEQLQKSNNDVDTEMDELTSHISKLKIPNSISFGHQSPSIPQQFRHHHHNTKSQKVKDVEMKEATAQDGQEEEEKKKVYLRPRKRGPTRKKTPTATTTTEEESMMMD